MVGDPDRRAPTSATASCWKASSGRAASTASPACDVLPDRWLAEGDTVEVGGHEFAVLHCPGHTPGHIVLYSKPNRFALVGGVLFRGSVGRTDFPYGDSATLLRSIREKLFPLGDEVMFLCGPGPGSTIALEPRSPISPQLYLRAARRKARRAGLDIAFHNADAAQLPFTIGRASLLSPSLA